MIYVITFCSYNPVLWTFLMGVVQLDAGSSVNGRGEMQHDGGRGETTFRVLSTTSGMVKRPS
jgi:hypothetical protein